MIKPATCRGYCKWPTLDCGITNLIDTEHACSCIIFHERLHDAEARFYVIEKEKKNAEKKDEKGRGEGIENKIPDRELKCSKTMQKRKKVRFRDYSYEKIKRDRFP
ncbi:hypothetical protein WN48_03839 [Eufriesea mexicana]|uniref:Uncharacterized protein n=1 Tax=Eufriesea mexicana TaxID=516756 RepID=A0A310SAM2_9HYME|nr:hypothetical protein WN48_03839 [Eufriesea mexicana]